MYTGYNGVRHCTDLCSTTLPSIGQKSGVPGHQVSILRKREFIECVSVTVSVECVSVTVSVECVSVTVSVECVSVTVSVECVSVTVSVLV